MKTLTYQSLIIVAALGLSVQANYGADSLSPSGFLNEAVGVGIGAVDTGVLTSGSIPTYSSPVQNFSSAAANTVGYSSPVGAEPLSIPEPTTLALAGFGGLIALTFARRFGKTHRA